MSLDRQLQIMQCQIVTWENRRRKMRDFEERNKVGKIIIRLTEDLRRMTETVEFLKKGEKIAK